MQIGDYVKVTCWTPAFFGWIMGIEIWEDEDVVAPYEMIEVLLDNGDHAYLPDDAFEVLS
jgi:hypothetical protein